jgi:hypothetical protein
MPGEHDQVDRVLRVLRPVAHTIGTDFRRVFPWNVVDPDQPGAQWSFELEPIGRTVRLRQRVIDHTGGRSLDVWKRTDA